MYLKTCLLFLSFVVLTGCAKTAEQIVENQIVKAMTDGQWHLTKFTKGGTDITTDFALYLFQFRKNNTVDAIKNGSVEKTGTWQADANARTISSSFENAATPLSLLNGTWKITNNSWTFVEASQTVNGEAMTLRLEK